MRQPYCGRWVPALCAALGACLTSAGCLTIHVPCGQGCRGPAEVVSEDGHGGCTGCGCASGRCGFRRGCAGGHCGAAAGGDDCPVPKELRKVSLPDYIVEPPDILY